MAWWIAEEVAVREAEHVGLQGRQELPCQFGFTQLDGATPSLTPGITAYETVVGRRLLFCGGPCPAFDPGGGTPTSDCNRWAKRAGCG